MRFLSFFAATYFGLLFSNSALAEIEYSTTGGLGNTVEGVITNVVSSNIKGVPHIYVTVRQEDGAIATAKYSNEHLLLGSVAANGIGKSAQIVNLGNNEVQIHFTSK